MMNKIKLLSNIAVNCSRNHKIITNNVVIKSHCLNNLSIDCKPIIRLNPIVINRLMSSSTIAEEVTEANEENEVLPKGFHKSKKRDPDRDRRVPISPDVSIKYMKSKAYRETYRNYMVWKLFRRNFKGQFSPVSQRRNCVEEGFVKTSNPCVICRDKYLVLHYTNIDLLKQFISPHTGYVYPNSYLCLCLDQWEKLLVAITLAKDYGLITFDIPFREYDYKQYYPNLLKNHNKEE